MDNLARRIRVFCTIIAAALSGAAAWAQSPFAIASVPTTADLWSVAAGNNHFVAVGTGGTILSSIDAVTWTAQTSGTNNGLVAVTFTGNEFIAVGDNGTILISGDGTSWTQVHTGGPRLNGVNFNTNGYIMVVGEQGAVLTSTDNGVTWVSSNSGAPSWLHGLISGSGSGGGVFFTAVGAAGTVVDATPVPNFAVTNTGASADLQAIRLIGFPAGVATFVIGANGYLATNDPKRWTQLPTPVSVNFNGILQASWSGLNQVIIVGDGGTVIAAESPRSSYDLRWAVVPTPTTANLLGVCSSGAAVVAVGQHGTVLVSNEGLGVPQIAFHQGPTTWPVGTSQTLAASVTGVGPYTYQWYANGQAVAGATSSSLTVNPVQGGAPVAYSVTVVNPYSSTTSSVSVSSTYIPVIPNLVDTSYNAQSATSGGATLFPDGTFFTGTAGLNSDGSIRFSLSQSTIVFSLYALEQPNGKTIVVRVTTPISSAPIITSLRFNADGSVDPTYHPEQTPGAFNGQYDDAEPSYVLPDGRMLSWTSGNVLVRLQADGTRDASYAPLQATAGGLVPTTYTASRALGATRLLAAYDASTGKIWVQLEVQAPSSPFGFTPTIFRLNSDGTPDFSFVPATLPAAGSTWFALNGKLYYYGTVPVGIEATADTFFGRLNSDGTNDTSYASLRFSHGYLLTIPAAYGPDGSLYWAVSPDSATPVTPATPLAIFAQTYRKGIVRFDPQGNFDPSFSLNLVDANPAAIGVTSDNRLYAWGGFTTFNGQPEPNGVVRLNLSAGFQLALLRNVSALGFSGTGAGALTGGFVVGGNGSKSVLIRGVGPALSGFGVPQALLDPILSLFDGAGALQGTFSNWSASPAAAKIAAAASAVFAFALPAGSADAATLQTVGGGAHTFSVTGASGDTGMAIAEMYDADTNLTYASPRLINISARAPVGPGHPLIGGFVVGGANTKRVMIRGVGPGLAQAPFSVPGTLADPVITLYSGSNVVAVGQTWGKNLTLVQETSAAVGAFGLPTGSADSALVITLSPGAYTAQVTSAANGSGLALVEVYEVP